MRKRTGVIAVAATGIAIFLFFAPIVPWRTYPICTGVGQCVPSDVYHSAGCVVVGIGFNYIPNIERLGINCNDLPLIRA